MKTGSMYLWRLKKDGKTYRVGYVCQRKGNMLEIGSYNGATKGVWVKETEVEYENY